MAIAAVVALPACARPQGPPPPRPKVGLVLSGGGARGAAHAGVLKVLEEHRVPVDLVVGTSMGAIVGGLYACGLSPEEIEAGLTRIDWDDFFNDSPSRRHLPFRRKQEDQDPLFDFELGVGPDGFKFPAGLIAGQKLGYLLSEMTLCCAGNEDFDALQMPFRAVATDLNTGERVVIGEGSLADAMRASMAVPGAFTPVEIDGRTLVDGGLVGNLPVDVARMMGADVVLVVDVSPPVRSQGDRLSAADALVQSFYILLEQNQLPQRESLSPPDVLIVPDLGDMESSDFSAAAAVIEGGEAAARLAARELSRLSVDEDEYRVFLERQRRSLEPPLELPPVDAIEVATVAHVDSRIVAGVLKTTVGVPVDLDVLRDDLDRVYELGDFESVGFRLDESGGERTLVINAKEKPWGPNLLRAGLVAEADSRGRSDFTALVQLVMTRVNPYGGEWRLGFRFGGLSGISAELYQPVDFSGTFFVSPRLSLLQRRSEVFVDGALDEEYRVATFEGGLDVGAQLRNHGEVRAGVLLGTREAVQRRGSGAEMSALGGCRFGVTIDQVDSMGFPRSGTFASVNGQFLLRELGSDRSYSKGAFDGCSALSVGDHTVAVVARGRTSLGSDVPDYEQFDLGGLLELSGYERGQLQGSYVAFAEILYYYRLVRLPGPFGTGVYVGCSVEGGNVWDDAADVALSDLRYAGSTFVGADTLFGPLYVGVGLTERGQSTTYISLGGSILRH